jgi:3-methylcrotonyl-CoA carboxylase alpha subunit
LNFLTLTLEHRYGIEGGAGSGGSSIRAPMPGKVVKLLVESGTQVAIGEPVMVLEAMKMEHVLEAPCDGTIDEIFAAVGDFVDDSSDLVRFSDDEE